MVRFDVEGRSRHPTCLEETFASSLVPVDFSKLKTEPCKARDVYQVRNVSLVRSYVNG